MAHAAAPPYRDRRHAGRVLADLVARRLDATGGANDPGGPLGVVVLGLPRGGVPVAAEVAHRLHAPLDVMVVRKLGVPGREELAMGALASGGVRILNEPVVDALRIAAEDVDRVAAAESVELSRREAAYRGDRPVLPVEGRTVVMVDDGLATGATMRAAVAALRSRAPARVVVAVPSGSATACAELAGHADDVVCAETPVPFRSVGDSYLDFGQTSDDEVRTVLRAAGG